MSAYITGDKKLIDGFKRGRDAYATLVSVAMNYPYEECLEFKLDEHGNKTSEVNPEGKARRSLGKILNLGRIA